MRLQYTGNNEGPITFKCETKEFRVSKGDVLDVTELDAMPLLASGRFIPAQPEVEKEQPKAFSEEAFEAQKEEPFPNYLAEEIDETPIITTPLETKEIKVKVTRKTKAK